MAAIKLSGGQKYKPAEQQDEQRLPAEFANNPFVFIHYPAGWAWDDEASTFLPVLSRVFRTPGVNGVGDDLKLNRALGGSMAKGGTVIDPRNQRLGEWTDYVVRYPTQGGGFHYAFHNTQFEVLPGGKTAIVPDDTYRAFLIHLVNANIVDPIADMVVNGLIDTERVGLERLIRAAQSNEHRAADVEAKRARIARMEAFRTGGEAASEESPKRGRRVAIKGATAPALDLSAEPS